MKRITKICAVILVVTLFMVSICDNGVAAVQAKSKSVRVSNGMYTVTSEKNKTARLDRISSKTKTSLTIPATVKIGKKTYKVTAIKANALKNSKKLKKLVIGKNVKKIGKQAFYGCGNLKKITIKTTKLTKKNVGKKAFAKLNSSVAIAVPTSKLYAYTKILKARGVTGKKQTVKSSATSDSTATSTPTAVPDPEVRFAIGELKSGVSDRWVNTSTDATYEAGDSVKFTMWAKMPQEMYGSWSTKKKAVTQYTKCICGKFFEYGTSNYAVHVGQTGCGAGGIVTNPGKPTVSMWYWTADTTPCKVVYHTTLPNGMTADPKDVEVWRSTNAQISQTDGKYTVNVSGQDVTVTINDIKQDIYRNYAKGTIFGVVVKFAAKIDETAANVSQVNASITYNYGKGDKIATMNSVIVRKK